MRTTIVEVGLARRGTGATSAIYGAVIATAVVVALSEDAAASAGEIIVAVVATNVVFWLVHVYAALLGEEIDSRRPIDWRGFRRHAVDELPMVLAAVPAIASLALGAFGLIGRSGAYELALAVSVAQLTFWGYVATRRAQRGVWRSVLGALFTTLLGSLLILLKAAIH